MFAVAVVGASGCFSGDVTTCADGRICAAGTVCDQAHGLCVLPDQLESCVGKATGDDCRVGLSTPGICRDEVCLRRGCGDGLILDREDCDGDNLGNVTGCADLGFYQDGAVTCTEDCRFDTSQCESFCGDGVADPTETCDGDDLGAASNCQSLGFYDDVPLTCTSFCTYDTSSCTGFCGDGVRNGPEFCEGDLPDGSCVDFGFDVGALGCSAFCTPEVSACGYLGWHEVPPVTGANLRGIWGTSDEEIFAVGLVNTVLHFDGTEWTTQEVPTPPIEQPPGGFEDLDAVWGAASDDIFAVGAFGRVLHYDGASWTAQREADVAEQHLKAVHGTGPSNVFAVGRGGTILRYDGAWSEQDSTTSANLSGVWATGTEAWAVGDGTTILHYTDSGWQAVSGTPAPSGTVFEDVWGAGPDDVFAVGFRVGPPLESVILHYDGTDWTLEPDVPIETRLRAVWGRGGDDVYAVSGSDILHYDGDGWVRYDEDVELSFLDVWESPDKKVYASAEFGLIYESPGRSFVTGTKPAPGGADWIYNMWGTSASDVWGVGLAGIVIHYDGFDWEQVSAPAACSLKQIWGAHAADVFAVGDCGDILHYDGADWQAMSYDLDPKQNLWGVWGSGPDDVFAVGNSGTILHYDGSAWSPQSSPTGELLFAVWGTGPDNVYAVGETTLLHYDGASWSEELAWPDGGLEIVWGSGPGDVYVAGGYGLLLHFDGSAWTQVTSPSTGPLYYLWGTGPDDIFATGPASLTFHFDGNNWGRMRLPESPGYTVPWGTGRTVHFVGPADLAMRLDRPRPWACSSVEAACGDRVDDDCDDLFDFEDPDCAGAIRLSEWHRGTPGFIEVVNNSSEVANLHGMTLAYRAACDTQIRTYTFPPDAIAYPGDTWRVIDEASGMLARERHLGATFCAAPDDGGWAALCAGACSCDTVVDYLETSGATSAVQPPCGGTFGPTPVDVSGLTAADSVVRVDFAGGAAGKLSDWTIASPSRD